MVQTQYNMCDHRKAKVSQKGGNTVFNQTTQHANDWTYGINIKWNSILKITSIKFSKVFVSTLDCFAIAKDLKGKT